MATNKKNIKVRDLKPKKDAKGGGGYVTGGGKIQGGGKIEGGHIATGGPPVQAN
jgi:hypothetical protein